MLTTTQGAIGLKLRFRITGGGGATNPVDLTPFVGGGSTLEIVAQPPTGPERTWAATIDGDPTSGQLLRTTVEGDLDQFGTWELIAHALKPGATEADPPELDFRSSRARLRVEAALDG